MHKGVKVYFIIMLSWVIAVNGYAAAPSTSCPEMKIGVVDFKELWTGLSAVKNLKHDLELTLKKAHQEFSEIESDLRQENANLLKLANEKKEKSDVTKLDKKRDSFERKIINVQKKAEKRQKSVNKFHAEAINKIKNIINQVIKEISEKNGISIVIYKDTILYHADSLDMTLKVFNEAEKRTRNIRLQTGEVNG